MNPKDQVLNSIRQLAAAGQVTESEVIGAYRGGAGMPAGASVASAESSKTSHQTMNVSRVLYFIGGLVVLIGIIVLIQQNWREFNSLTQILITLGVGIVAYVMSLLLQSREDLKVPSQVIGVIAGIIMPVGLGVLLHNLNINYATAEMNVLMAGVMLVIFGLPLILWRQISFTIFTVAYGSWLYGALVRLILRNMDMAYYTWHLYQYFIMALGAAYLLIGHGMSKSDRKDLRRFSLTLYTLGAIAVLAPPLSIGGAWDLAYPALVLAAIFGSIYLHSSALLRLGAFFLMAYLVKISAKYFSGNLGWPLALVLAGLLLMGVGYFTYYLNKKYIKTAHEGIQPQ